MKPWRGVLFLVLVVSIAAPGFAKPDIDWADRLKKCTLTLAEAVLKGLAQTEQGAGFHVELEQDGERLVFSVDIADKHQTINVVIDAVSGKSLETTPENEDHAAEVAAAKVPLASAIETALKAVPGQAVEAELELRSGKPVAEVRIFADGRIARVLVDCETGTAAPVESRGKAPDTEAGFTDTFLVEASEWASRGVNPWFDLTPGTVSVFEGKEDGETVRLTITVLDETRLVNGVETRVVEEREQVGEEIQEISRNYFAISTRTNCIYYFGEDSTDYEDGKVKDQHGSWLAGENGARFGLGMPGTPLIGARYYQEIAPGVALDRAEIVSLTETLSTPAGEFQNVLKILETTPLESGREFKYYAAGVGLLQDGKLRLVRHGLVGK